MNKRPPLTAAEAKQMFEAHGLSISQWAEENGFNVGSVYAVLNGSAPGKRGQAHRIAVALRMKEAPTGEPFAREVKK